MTIIYRLLKDGGFVAADTATRRTCYAYPTSLHAKAAARGKAANVALEMMKAENRLGAYRDEKFREYDDCNSALLNNPLGE